MAVSAAAVGAVSDDDSVDEAEGNDNKSDVAVDEKPDGAVMPDDDSDGVDDNSDEKDDDVAAVLTVVGYTRLVLLLMSNEKFLGDSPSRLDINGCICFTGNQVDDELDTVVVGSGEDIDSDDCTSVEMVTSDDDADNVDGMADDDRDEYDDGGSTITFAVSL